MTTVLVIAKKVWKSTARDERFNVGIMRSITVEPM